MGNLAEPFICGIPDTVSLGLFLLTLVRFSRENSTRLFPGESRSDYQCSRCRDRERGEIEKEAGNANAASALSRMLCLLSTYYLRP